MTDNESRTFDIIDQAVRGCPVDDVAGVATYDLLDAGLLPPDLPEPDSNGEWSPAAAIIGKVNINPAGEIVLHSGNFRDMTLHLTPSKSRDLANILNAAADHAEGVGRA